MVLSRRFATALLVGLACAPAQADQGPFGASTLTPLDSVPYEGATYAYRLAIAAHADVGGAVEIHLPSAAMFGRIDGLEGAYLDDEARIIRWQGTMADGQRRDVTLTLVAGLDAAGHTSSLHVTLRPWQGEPTYLSHVVEIDALPPHTVAHVGRVGITPAGLAVLGWLACTLLFWITMRAVRPTDAAWAPLAIMVPAGFLCYFALLAREDARILRLPQTTCTVVDRVLDSRTTSSSTRRSGPQAVYNPQLALRYASVTGERVAQGFGTDSRLSSASAARADALLARYAIGADIPCAIDDSDPRRGYVERGHGGAYFLALIPLPVFALGVWGLSRRR